MKVDFHFDNDGDKDTNKPAILFAVVVILAELCLLAFLIVQMLVDVELERSLRESPSGISRALEDHRVDA